ncbi:RagB/SusD family nutrient uptake outer membrane protein [Ravibacter arvi]|uniref:RagB/SusD family nutrient uptake outer membrane protein n=1 Tax=Ravibacter arvi TaxID=2051041 RepID=A0ABP8LQB0_9BACT
MKKISNHFLRFGWLLSLLLGSYGCDNLLEEKPKATIVLAGLTPETLDQAIIGAYEPLTRSRGRLWESSFSQALNMMSEYFDGGTLGGFGYSNYQYLNPAVVTSALDPAWTTLYEAIGKANTIIATLDENKTLTEAQKNVGYAEAKFIRALGYYTAVRVWGKVPLRVRPIQSADDVHLAVSEIADIYKQIVEDLKAAEVALPDRVPSAKAGRATAGAAKTALAEVYLTLGDFQNARDKAREVLDKKALYGYELEQDFVSIFSPTAATNKEDIFSLKFSQIIDRGTFIPTHYADANAKAAGFALRSLLAGGVMSWAPLIRDWDPADLRFQFSVYDSYLLNGVRTPVAIASQLAYFDRLMGKFRDPNAPIDTGGGTDFYLWRFADVLLIFAEADNQVNGPTTEALEAVNQVRRRGYGLPVTTASKTVDLPSTLTKQAFDEMVFRERGYEFVGECKRWFDMVRTKRVDVVLEGVRMAKPANAARKATPVSNFFPMPDTERQTNNLID